MPHPRRANPGGEIAPADVIGRDALVRRIWSTLANQSVQVIAERRMGKTTVIKKMRHDAPAGHHFVFRDVEGLSSPLEFAEAVAKDLLALQPAKTWAKSTFASVYAHLAGAEIAGVVKFPAALAPHWKELLQASVASALEAHPGATFVFAWDELPYMLDKVRRTSTEADAMEILDTLRGLRQTHSHCRMVFSGSIGLHHVLTGLRDAGHTSAPVNDMRTIEVGELDEPDALALATALFQGEGLTGPDPADAARALCEAVDRVPYYIHHVVADLRDREWSAARADVERAVHHALVDAHDPWNLMHYRQRVDTYYAAPQVPVVLAVLDVLEREPLTFTEVANRVRSTRFPNPTPFTTSILEGEDEPLRSLLDLLARDHYLRRDPDTRCYTYRFSLIQRWWRLHRGT
jgi:hypothetical protein